MRNRYLDFLSSIVGKEDNYSRLLEQLHGIEYKALIPNDDNRGEDGKQLRYNFNDREGQHALSFFDSDECSVLEMLIGLSLRLELETGQSRWEKTPSEWFWILVDNLGLAWCSDDSFESLNAYDHIGMKVGIFLDRQYAKDGTGGLFPLKKPRKDQRRVEIWYQMSAYVLENYPI